MSVTSSIWTSAYIRRCNINALPCTVVRKGAAEAGAIFVCIRISEQEVWIMGPPPGPTLDDIGERIFEPRMPKAVTQREADAYIARQADFDADIWVIEVEDRDGTAFLR